MVTIIIESASITHDYATASDGSPMRLLTFHAGDVQVRLPIMEPAARELAGMLGAPTPQAANHA